MQSTVRLQRPTSSILPTEAQEPKPLTLIPSSRASERAQKRSWPFGMMAATNEARLRSISKKLSQRSTRPHLWQHERLLVRFNGHRESAFPFLGPDFPIISS